MNDLFMANSMSLLIFGVLYISFIFTPKITRKDIVFGVVIPLDRTKDEEIKRISKSYYTWITTITIVIALAHFVILNGVLTNPGTLVISIFIIIGGYFLVFLSAHNKVKEYKKKNNVLENKKQVVYVNTTMSQKLRNSAVIKPYWFGIPAVIALLNLILPVLNYNSIPERIGVHWNIQGVADNFIDKSMGGVISNGMMPLILVVIMFFVNYSIAISKNKIDASQPVTSSERLYKFKKFNSIMIYGLCILITSLLTMFNLNSMRIITVNLAKLTPIIILSVIVIILVPIIVMMKIGQGGSNLKGNSNEEIDNNISNIDDDYFWKLGTIYYNPNDPSLFVEKRFGVGWTLNFGNKYAIVISVGLVILIIAMTLMPIIFS